MWFLPPAAVSPAEVPAPEVGPEQVPVPEREGWCGKLGGTMGGRGVGWPLGFVLEEELVEDDKNAKLGLSYL